MGKAMNRERILIIRLSALGDVVNTLAFVNRLRKAKPDAHITWILQPLTYDLVKEQGNIDRFVIFDKKKGLSVYLKLYHELQGETFDQVFMLQVSIKASLISLCVKGREKLGFDFARAREMQWLFSNRRIPAKEPRHVLDQFFEFLDCLDLPDAPLDWDIQFTDEELAYRNAFFQAIPREVVSFVIASSKAEKDWTVEGYAQVMDWVDEKLQMQPMIVGGPSAFEREKAEKICAMCHCRPVLAFEKPVRHSLLQLSGSRVVVAPDTGPMHMAVALNVPTVALYGYTDPRRCGPYARFQDLLINAYHSPEEKLDVITRRTRKNRMETITPEAVFAKIQTALSCRPEALPHT